jgi:hypothetical protein
MDIAVTDPRRRARLAFLLLLDGAMVAGSAWFLVRYVSELGAWLRTLPALDTTTLMLVGVPATLALGTAALGAYAAWGITRAWRGDASVHTRLATAISVGFGGFVIMGVVLAFVVACVAGVIVTANLM